MNPNRRVAVYQKFLMLQRESLHWNYIRLRRVGSLRMRKSRRAKIQIRMKISAERSNFLDSTRSSKDFLQKLDIANKLQRTP